MKTKLLLMLPMVMMMMACASEQQPRERVPEYEDITDANSVTMIPYEPQGDHEIVTVAFNGVPMNLLWDTGCSVTTIPYTEFARMIREDKISGYDYNDTKYAQIADGSLVENYEFNISTVTFNTVDGKAICATRCCYHGLSQSEQLSPFGQERHRPSGRISPQRERNLLRIQEMNFSLHITSLSGKSFEAYPLDDKVDYLKSFCTDVDGNALAMWTEHGLMYYYSIFKLPNDSVFGLLLSFKDMVITRPRALLKIMSGIVIDQMPKRGKILQYSTSGDLVFVNSNFADDPQAIDGLRSEIHKTLTQKGREIGCKTMALPALSSPKDVVAVSATEDYSSIQDFIFTQRRAVVISTEATYTTDATYAIIFGLQSQIQEKEAELDKQSETIKQLERSRKQYRFVMVLLGILLCSRDWYIQIKRHTYSD